MLEALIVSLAICAASHVARRRMRRKIEGCPHEKHMCGCLDGCPWRERPCIADTCAKCGVQLRGPEPSNRTRGTDATPLPIARLIRR